MYGTRVRISNNSSVATYTLIKGSLDLDAGSALVHSIPLSSASERGRARVNGVAYESARVCKMSKRAGACSFTPGFLAREGIV
jgi:hypothetical protein